MPDPNHRAVIGSNTPDAVDYAREESERLQRDYAELATTAVNLEAEADAITEITDASGKEVVVNLIKRIRDVKVRIEALHGLEKQPHFRRGQGVDQFFFGIWDRLLKRDKKNRDGIGDSLGKMLTDYDVRVLAEEQERRRKEFEAAEAIRIAAENKRIADERAADEARQAAERARKPETTAAKTEVAEQAAEVASTARVEETVATARAEEAYVSTLSRPADIMRSRTAGGTLSTMQQETYAEIETVGLLDGAKLWAFVPYAEKEKALRAWAKGTDFREPMAGAKIGRRPKSTVR